VVTARRPGAAGEAPTVPAAPTREPEPAAAGAGSDLDRGSLGGAVVAERLSNPRVLAALIALVALVAFLLGRRSTDA
jgi:hypothetical protein